MEGGVLTWPRVEPRHGLQMHPSSPATPRPTAPSSCHLGACGGIFCPCRQGSRFQCILFSEHGRKIWRQSGPTTRLSPDPSLSSCSSHLPGCPKSNPGGWDDWVALFGSSQTSRCGEIWEAGLSSYHYQMPNKPSSGPQANQPPIAPPSPTLP